MLTKVQRKGMRYTQLISFSATLLIGLIIILFGVQLYFDVQGVMTSQEDAFAGESAIISKKVSIFKTMDKSGLYFSPSEIDALEKQDFIEEVGTFRNASFKIMAFTGGSGQLPPFYTDLFFESIPNSFLDVQTDEWKWEEQSNFIPVIVPESYLNLYNFGFAESQGLPVFSKNTISNIGFKIRIGERGSGREFNSRIVGFSSKINSILVPDDFLKWANDQYGNEKNRQVSRVLVKFDDAPDEKALSFFNEQNYDIDQSKLKANKLVVAFKSVLGISIFLGVVILSLSVALMIFGILLIIQRNETEIINLGILGYSHASIARFYLITISLLITVMSIAGAWITDVFIRSVYLQSLEKYFNAEPGTNYIYLLTLTFALVLLAVYNLIVYRRVKNIVR